MNEDHNQEQYEAYMNQDIDRKPLLKNCDCYMCQEETRVLIGDSLKEMGMSNSEIQAEMIKMKLIFNI
jgi:queuine/archaeosine tRNA-ribosyltransferase